ncbi:MAG: molybdate ABC transporter substrate-binding protein [Pseudomonadales bacterium]
MRWRQLLQRCHGFARRCLPALVLGTMLSSPSASLARESSTLVAVATNFAPTAERLLTAFAQVSNAPLRLTSGSSGKLFAQITQGAPYDLFLSADAHRPGRLAQLDLVVPGCRKTYALGTLVLWSLDPALVSRDGRATLREQKFRRLAIANPDLAPYGAAARDVLTQLQLYQPLTPAIVRGENVGQAYAMIASGNAELGFIAGSALRTRTDGSHWLVPAELHQPIRQQAVLLRRAEDDSVARAFFEFLSSDAALAVIRADGYRLDGER